MWRASRAGSPSTPAAGEGGVAGAVRASAAPPASAMRAASAMKVAAGGSDRPRLVMPRAWPAAASLRAILVDDAQDALAGGGADGGIREVAAQELRLDVPDPREAGRLAGRLPLHEGRGTGEDAVPGLAEQGPERLPLAGERRPRRALALGEADVPGLARLARQRGPRAVGVDRLHVVLALEPARAVGHDARGALERVVVLAAHVPRLAAGNGRVVGARPLRIRGAGRPRRGALVAEAVVEVGDPPRPHVGGAAQVAHAPGVRGGEVVEERGAVLPVLGLVADHAPRAHRA